MSESRFSRHEMVKGVSFSTILDRKFMMNRLSVNFIVPLAEETASDYAMLTLMMRRGCRSYPDFTQLNRHLDMLYGAELSADVYKLGANQILTFSVTAIDDRYTFDKSRLLRECALLLRSIIQEPLIDNGAFPAHDFEVERQFLIDTIEAEINDKRSWAAMQCIRLMGKDSPATLRKYGTLEGAKRTTPQSAAAAWQRMTDTADIEIVYTGSGDCGEAEAVFADAFAPRQSEYHFLPAVVVPTADHVQEVTERLDVVQSKLVLGCRTGERPAFDKQAAMRLAVSILGGTPSSKLFLNVREKQSLCYYCSARYSRIDAIMLIESGIEHQNVDAARKAILKEVDDLKHGDFTDETMQETRLQLINALNGITDSAGNMEDWYINRIIMGEMSTPAEEIEQFKRVTREDVIEAASHITLDTVYLLTQKQEGNADDK